MLATWGARWPGVPVEVLVPTWNFATTLALLDVMTAMGLRHVFGDGDFTGIAADMPAISDAVAQREHHRRRVRHGRRGRHGLAFRSGAMPPPSTRFHADRPLAFTIVDGALHVPLFSGIVADPSA